MKSKFLLAVAIFITCSSILKAQVITTFKPRYQVTQKGGIVFLSNVATTCFVADTNALPPNTGATNNSLPSLYVDRDNDASTFSSTSDSLNLATCSEISFVGLYWGGNATATTLGWATKDQIKIKANSGAYINITADSLITNAIGFTTYHCFKDVTSIVKAAGLNARWTVANVIGETNQNNKFAGWNMIVVYKNDLQNMRQLTVFNGLAVVNTATVDIPVSGFLTPPTGPVTFEMGLYCYDGDRSTTGDALSFSGTGPFVAVSDAINGANNAFNSTIGRNGVLTPFRKPNYNNNYSVDADIFIPDNSAKNYIGNGATSCTLRQTTSGDVYLTQAVTFAIDVYSPDVRTAVSVQDINGGTVQPGDTLEYKVIGKNIGSDPSINTFITDSIEANAEFIPGTITVTAGPNLGLKTDAAGDDQAEYLSATKTVRVRIGTGANGTSGGQVNDSPFGIDSTTFTFRVKVSTDCYKIACDNIINNSALITGTGITSGISYTNASNPGIFDAFGCPIPGATTTPINSSSCVAPPDTSIEVCNVPSAPTFASVYTRPGYVFYNSGGTIVASPSGAGSYYAVYTAYSGCTDTVNITITFKCNIPPVLDNETNVINEDTQATGDLTDSGDSDPDGTALTVNVNPLSGPTNGSILINTDGTYTYTPNANFNGTDLLVVQICDNGTPLPIACTNDTIFITVTPVNDPPVANDDNGPGLTEDGPNGTVNVVTNDTDADGNPTAPVNGVGQFTVDLDPGTAGIQTTFTDAQGVWTLNTATGVVTFDPANNYNGTAVIPYTLCDPSGACDNANITFVVTPVNDPPVANDDNGPGLTEDGPNGTVNVITNDTDADGNPTAPVNGVGQFTVDLDPGTAGIQTTFTDAQGVWTLNTATGVVTFDPANNYNGTAVIPYTLCDPSGACVNANISFVVTPVNDAPIANGDNASTNEDTPITLPNVLANDVDVDNALSPSNIDLDPLTPGIQSTESTPEGNWSVNTATGQVTFTPATNFNGTATNIYEICDGGSPNLCDTAVITINVTAINDAPVANADNGSTIQNTPVTLPNILSNDMDVDNTLSPTNIDLDPLTPGIQSAESTPEGTWSVNTTTGEVTFTPDVSFSGTATNIYEICDGGTPNLCDTAIISIVVSPGTPPVALGDNGSTLTEDGANGTVNVLANDTDGNGNPSAPTNGAGQFTVDLNTTTAGIQTSNTTPQGVWTYNPTTGDVTFDPANDFNGTATLIYELCDPTSLCDTAVITFEVNAINDAPVANDDAATTYEDTPTTIAVLNNDSDVDNPLQPPVVVSNPANGTVTVNADSTITYTPNLNFNGSDTFTYVICDGGTPDLCDTAMVIITVNAVNDAPIATDNTNTTDEETSVNGDVYTDGTDDSDVDGPAINVTTVSGPGNGTVTLNLDGTYTYTPDAGFNGNDTVTYSYCDGGTPDLCDTAILVITVNAINDAPVANDDAATTDEDTPTTIAVLTNDSDVDNPLQPPVVVSNPANGTVTVNADSTITYTPNPNYNGNDTFTYVICDGGTPNLCDTATVIITVTPINDAPVATDNTNTTDEETAVNGDVYTDGNDDSDVDGPAINVTTVSGPGNGTVTLNLDGTYTYTPDAGFNGNDTVTYSYCDGGTPDLCDTAILVITVSPVNDAPVADDDNATTDEDTPTTIAVLTNDSDVDNPLQPPVVVSNPTNGTVTVNADSTITYTPNLNFNGTDTFTYTICDGATPDLCDTAMVIVTVNAVNDAPVATDNTNTTDEETSVSGNVYSDQTSDSDVDGPGIIITQVSGPDNGAITLNTDGSYTYTPGTGFNGNDTVTYSYCDGGTPDLCDTAILVITVNAINDAPVANDDAATTDEDTPTTIAVLTNDSDADNPLQPPVVVSNPANGTVTVNADSTITYTPNPNYNGNDTFTYVICDGGTPDLCDTAMVIITVNAINDAPVATDNTNTTDEETAVSGNVYSDQTSDSDVDGPGINITQVSGPDNGAITLNTDGSYTYTPGTGFNGNDTVTYSYCDGGTPDLCDTAILVITVNAINDAPVANDDAATTDEDTPTTIAVLTNDSDVDNPLQPPVVVSNPANGTVTVNADSTITYTPNLNFNGTDTFTYAICDGGTPDLCDTATVIITVNAVNDAPIANDDTNTTDEDTPVNGTVSTNDTDVDGPSINITEVIPPANGTITLNGNGTYTYTPNTDFNGSDTVTYSYCDGGTPDLCDTAILVITINAVNDTPAIGQPPLVLPEDSAITFCPVISDPDAGDMLTISFCGGPYGGTASLTGNCINYSPNANFNGVDSICLVVCDDGNPVLCDTIVVSITVTAANDAPVAVDDANSTEEETPVSGTVVTNDSDVDGPGVNDTPVSGPSNGAITLNVDGSYIYTPNTGFNGNDTIVYSYCDGGTPDLCDTALLIITVAAVNDTPVIGQPPLVLPEDSTIIFCPVLSDPDAGDVLTVSICGGPFNGLGTANANCITYTPGTNSNGEDSICLIVCDNGTPVLCDTVIVPITVTPVNDKPIANDDVIITLEETPVVITVLANDSDVEGALNNPTVIDQPSNGTVVVNVDGTITYTPNNGFNGVDTFVYVVCDTGQPALCDTAVVIVTVNAQNDPPVAIDDNITTTEDTPVTINVLSNDSDPEGNIDPAPAVIDNPENGTVTVNTDGTITYTPNPDYNGVDSFTYVICDSAGLCDTAMVYVTVTPAPDAPVVVPVPLVTDEDVPGTQCFSYTTDDNLDSVSISVNCPASNGTVDSVYLSDGQICIAYTPNQNYNGLDSTCIQLCDLSNGLCVTVTVPVTVNPKEDLCYWLKGISPNGDNQNDNFWVNCNDEFPDATLRVFNRWGDEVWRSDGHYMNDWFGRNMRDQSLPDGTYYYVYEYNRDGRKAHAGFVTINR